MRQYYTDPYTVEFEAEIIRTENNNGKTAVILDRSFFYPTSGGQDHDTGAINGRTVFDVIEDGEDVVHLMKDDPGIGKAHCVIDQDRRYRNMQQHTGQHILSAAFENLFDIQTVSSRLGEMIGTIDLSRTPTAAELEEVVATSNKIIEENRPVVIHFADSANLSSFRLRKDPKVQGTVRIVEVADFDFSPCGGTHCTHTSEVGTILTGNMEKVKAALTRIEFACGRRARDQYYKLLRAASESSRLLSAPIEEMPEAVAKIKDQLRLKDGQIKDLSLRMVEEMATKIRARLIDSGERFPVIDLTDYLTSQEEIRSVASIASKESKRSFVVYRIENGSCQMSIFLMADETKASEAIDSLRRELHAKGGGRSGFYSLVFEQSYLPDIVKILSGVPDHG